MFVLIYIKLSLILLFFYIILEIYIFSKQNKCKFYNLIIARYHSVILFLINIIM